VVLAIASFSRAFVESFYEQSHTKNNENIKFLSTFADNIIEGHNKVKRRR